MDEINTSIPVQYDARTFPILASLQTGEMLFLRTLTVGVRVRRGVQVIREGQENNYLFLLKSGMLKVEKNYRGRVYSLACITPGQIFGESSFLYGTPAGATVTTIETSDIYQIHSHEMHAIIDSNEQFRRAVVQTSEYRLASGALAVNHVFQHLPAPAREVILYNARFVKLNEGELLYRDGDITNMFMCIIIGGRAEVSVNHPDKPGKRIIIGEVAAGDEVGEIALLTEDRHCANVRALTLLRLLMINTDTVMAFRNRYPAFNEALDRCVTEKLEERARIIEQQREFLS